MRKQASDAIHAIRALAILLIVFSHVNIYIPMPSWLLSMRPYTITLGLSLFIFITGILAAEHHSQLPTWSCVWKFMLHRMRRIYPLYLIAIPVFVFVFHVWKIPPGWQFSPLLPKIVVQFFSMQAVCGAWLAPFYTLWYIGLIMVYYLIYAIAARLSKGSILKLLIGLSVLFCIALVLHKQASLFDERIFLYAPALLLGIIVAKVEKKEPSINPWIGYWLIALALAAVIFRSGIGSAFFPSNMQVFIQMPLLLIFMCGSTTGLYSVLSHRSGISQKCVNLVKLIAVASFPVYLFHQPLLALVAWQLQKYIYYQATLYMLIMVGLALPAVFIIGYYIQQLERRVVGRFESSLKGQNL